MADAATESVDVKLPTGETITAFVPTGWSDAQIHTNLLAKHPEFFHTNAPTSEQQAAAMPALAPQPINAQNMQTSNLPTAARVGINAIPPVAAAVGGIGGATFGGAGAPLGAAAGFAAGNPIRQKLSRMAFGDQEAPAPSSKQGITETGIGAGVTGALEIPGALLQGYGNILVKQLANAKDATQVGDVMNAIKSVSPKAATKAGLIDSLETANQQLSKNLSKTLSSAQGTVDIENTMTQARARAAIEDLNFMRGSRNTMRVSNMVNDAVAAAKSEAGITGRTATAQQIADFQRAIQRQAFKASQVLGPGSVTKDVLTDIYSTSGGALRTLAPDADPILKQMTDIHAATNAVKNYSTGKLGSIAITAATHPKTTAAVSPFIIPGAVAGAEAIKPAINKVKGLIP